MAISHQSLPKPNPRCGARSDLPARTAAVFPAPAEGQAGGNARPREAGGRPRDGRTTKRRTDDQETDGRPRGRRPTKRQTDDQETDGRPREAGGRPRDGRTAKRGGADQQRNGRPTNKRRATDHRGAAQQRNGRPTRGGRRPAEKQAAARQGTAGREIEKHKPTPIPRWHPPAPP